MSNESKPKGNNKGRPLKNNRSAIKTKDPVVAAIFKASFDQNMTLSDIRDKTGLSLNAISHWKQGYAYPNAAFLSRLAKAVNRRIIVVEEDNA
jgi:hypothetical protein